VISEVNGIFNFSLSSTIGKNDFHSAPLSVLSHCLYHYESPFFFSSEENVDIGILFYTILKSPSFSAASLASFSASSFPSIPA
jgi:hypothetical protein